MGTLSGIDSLSNGEHVVHVLLYNVGGPYFYDMTPFTVANDPEPPVISHVPVSLRESGTYCFNPTQNLP